MFKHKVE